MLSYFYKKFFSLVVSLFFVITLTFILMKCIPGDPFVQEQIIPKEILETLHAHYGLDKPLYVQYLTYLKGIFTGNLGPSFIYQGRTVNQIILEGFPISAYLGLQALSLALFLGITIGSLSAYFKNTWVDRFFMVFITLGISVPGFLLATLLQYCFAIKLGIFPVARWESFLHTLLPTVALAAMPATFIAKLIRSSMLEVLQQDFIKMAYAKGLSSFQVLTKHALRNALLPVVSYLGPVIAQILTGSFVIEKIFGIPGLGQWLIMSVYDRDYTMILGLTIFFSSILIFTVFITDILYQLIDPRIQLRKKMAYETIV